MSVLMERARLRPTVDAGLLTRRDGGPVRLRRNGRQPKAVGLYFSVKSGRHLPYESKLELHDIWRAEVDSDVVSSLPQPFTLQLVRGGELTRYTPDRLDLMADGSRLVVEVKDQLPDADVQSRLTQAAEALATRGFRFSLRLAGKVREEPRFSGVEVVQRHRRTKLDEAERHRIARLLAGGPLAFSVLADAMHAGPTGSAMICAAAVQRRVRIDLSEGLHAEARVELLR